MTSTVPHPPQDPRPGTVATGTVLAYTAEQAAAIIGGTCKASWLKAQAREGKIDYTWIGGSYNFTRAQIDQIIALCERPARKTAPAVPAAAKRTPAKRAAAARPPLALGTGVTLLEARPPRKRKVA